MSSKRQMTSNDEIDLRKVILTLRKEKKLLILITLIFIVVSCFYWLQKPKLYQASFTIEKVPESLFIEYEENTFIKKSLRKKSKSLHEIFNRDLQFYLKSKNNLINFLEQNRKSDEYKSYIKKDNVNFFGLIKVTTNPGDYNVKKNTYDFLINYSEPLPSIDFLNNFINDYMYHAKQVVGLKIKNNLKMNVNNEIKKYKLSLKTATVINLEYPHVYFSPMNDNLYLKGTRVLNEQIKQLEALLNELENVNFNYEQIIIENTFNNLISISINKFIIIASLMSLISSLIIIFVKSTSPR